MYSNCLVTLPRFFSSNIWSKTQAAKNSRNRDNSRIFSKNSSFRQILVRHLRPEFFGLFWRLYYKSITASCVKKSWFFFVWAKIGSNCQGNPDFWLQSGKDCHAFRSFAHDPRKNSTILIKTQWIFAETQGFSSKTQAFFLKTQFFGKSTWQLVRF